MYQFILASESPRRRQLLQTSGFVFEVHPVKVSEIPDKNLNIDEQILDIAGRKSEAAFSSLKGVKKQDFLVLAVDTMVVLSGRTLGKPVNSQEAFDFLKLLSGKTHEVKTALCLVESRGQQRVSQIETSKVSFKILSDDEIWTYIQSGEPMDKAGAYAIQGLGGKFVDHLEGGFDNVVGLSIKCLESMLEKNHWLVERKKS